MCLFSKLGKHASGHCAVALQVDSFNRHASGKGGGKLSRLFSTKKSPRGSPSPSGPTTPQPSGGSISLDDMLLYQPVSFSCPEVLKATCCCLSCARLWVCLDFGYASMLSALQADGMPWTPWARLCSFPTLWLGEVHSVT